MTVCGNCGAKIVFNAKFCPECGAKQTYPSPVEKSMQPNLCMNCGAKLEPNDKFCEECGTRVSLKIAKEPPKPNLCTNCGAKLEPNAKFCEQCGERTGTIQIAEPLSVGQRIESGDVIRILLVVSGLLPVLGIFVLNAFGMLVFPIIAFIAYLLYQSKGLDRPAKVFRNIGIFQVFGLIWFFIPFGVAGNIYGIAMVVSFGIILPLILSLSAIIDTPYLVKKVSLEKKPPVSSGVWINCKKTGMPLAISGPYALINDMQRRELDWDNEVFIPLEPNIQHKIAVQFRYFGFNIGRSSASFFIQLSPNEIQNLEYEIRSFVTKPYALITKKS